MTNEQTKKLTTNSGIPVSDNQNSLTAGERGPTLIQDHHLVEKLAHFNRERIPERIVHAKAAGAHGVFTVTNDITKYTRAKIFSEVGKKTEVFGRFSTVAGEDPDNYFAEVEQAAFSPANVVPGISFSPCKMLQARIFAYADAQRYRLGVNYEHLPINRPRAAEVNNYQRDGYMRFDDNGGASVNYEPNSFGGPKEDPAYKEPPLKISGDADWYEQKRGVDDDYIQPGNLFRLMSPEEQNRLVENIAASLRKVPKDIQKKMAAHFRKADKRYGEGVAKTLGI